MNYRNIIKAFSRSEWSTRPWIPHRCWLTSERNCSDFFNKLKQRNRKICINMLLTFFLNSIFSPVWFWRSKPIVSWHVELHDVQFPCCVHWETIFSISPQVARRCLLALQFIVVKLSFPEPLPVLGSQELLQRPYLRYICVQSFNRTIFVTRRPLDLHRYCVPPPEHTFLALQERRGNTY